jgi:serine/threonine protein phosphatase 1
MWRILLGRDVRHVVFLGDFINKGAESARVLEELIKHRDAGLATLLRGNHEDALLDALDGGDLRAFLRMGGAATIRSYLGAQVGPDVLADFRAGFPARHLEALRSMPGRIESSRLVAQHEPPAAPGRKFAISAHAPVGNTPRITSVSAQIDTGCGPASGRLTALLWPQLQYVQVDGRGTPVTS